jgi:hypothetical protein
MDGFWEDDLDLWDTAAGVLLVKEAGGFVTDYRGTAMSMPATGSAEPSTGAGRAARRSKSSCRPARFSAPKALLSPSTRSGSISPTGATASPRWTGRAAAFSRSAAGKA